MPALETHLPKSGEPSFGHVNLMIDTFIANVDSEELRGIVRELLVASPPSVSARLATIVRSRLRHKLLGCGPSEIPSSPLFRTSEDGLSRPGNAFYQTLQAIRPIYGAGLGSLALQHLALVVQQTIDLRWEEEGEMADSLAVLDSDMTQAIQSSKEQQLREENFGEEARKVVKEFRFRVSEASKSVKSWGGEFPFERTEDSLKYWKV